MSTAAPQDHLWWIAPTSQSSISSATATQNARDAAAAQEAVETYYHMLEEKNYPEAYALLSPRMPQRKALEDWIAEREQMVNAVELISVQHYPDFQATWAANEGESQTTNPLYESETCKVFLVTLDIDYVGGWGAGPSGIDSSFVIMIKESTGWHLVEIASGLGRDACQRY